MTAPANPNVLQDRYGTSRKNRLDKRLGISLGVLLAAILAFFFWNALFASDSSTVSVRDISHTIDSDKSATLTFGVTAPVDAAIQCEIEALSKSYSPLGYEVIEVAPTGTPERVVTHTLRTINEVTTITASACWRAD